MSTASQRAKESIAADEAKAIEVPSWDLRRWVLDSGPAFYAGYTTGNDPHWPEFRRWIRQYEYLNLSTDQLYERLGGKAGWFRPSRRCEFWPDCSVCKDP